ncbi:putative Ig domain-containing protein [Mesorhizobium sp. B2-5-5]|uniref:putative Ig domain-containing protein n=1 Tax=Mesorhizobium sp. B2-5-5 TaxID=2589925 RepID=UPI0015E34915|nr:putative Ig domain-containing protein [Mesorhizobium sp. B2-5-5]
MTKLTEVGAKFLMTEFGSDAGIGGDWLNIDDWTQPSGKESGNETGHVLSDLGEGLAAETSQGSHTPNLEPAASKLDLISDHGIIPPSVDDGGLKFTGQAEVPAGLAIHLDSTFVDSARNHADRSVTYTAAALADTGTVSTGGAVATSSLLAASSSAIDPIFETRVATAGDDVEEKGSGTIGTNINDLELGYDGSTRQTVGLRFTGIDIPKGAIITSAYIQFQANEVKTGAASLLIQGDNTDDASPFTSAAFNVSSLPRTTASTAWTPDPWTIVGEHGLAERTPDLTAIVQEVVNRSGWVALNDMAFVVTGTGTRTADSYEYNPASAPLLHIEYLLPGSSNPVAFNTPADANAAANQIAELAAAGAPTGITASATDPDAGSTVTYSINDSRFAIDSSSGVITRSATGTLDFETQPSINLTVTATSSDGSTANQAFTLAVLNSPEPVAFNAVPDANPAANQIAQNAAAGTTIGITASATDPDAGSTVSYSIGDSRFAINASTGVITRSSTGTLNAQSEPSVALTVTATSSDGSIDTHAFNVNVTASQMPVAFNTPADANAAANQIAELAAAGAPTGITASATDPDAGSTVTYSINDARFAINSSTGVITRSAVGTLDFETQPSINLTVTATSSDGSTANKSFTLAVLDSPESVAFNAPPDANTAANQILQSAAAGTAVGITASASDPDAGSTVTYTIDDSRFAINASTGVVTRSSTGTLNAQSEPTINFHVKATSSDGSFDTHTFTVDVTSQLPTSVTLAHTILTSQWSPPSPDPTDIVYISHLGTLLVADSEVDEMPIFTGKNLYQMNLAGNLMGTLTTINFSDEPAGVTYNPANHHLFFADDTGTKSVYELNPGKDGLYNTSDDIVTSFKTAAFGSKDSEALAYDTKRGVLYLEDGSNHNIYTIAPGQNGKFDGVPSTGGDDVVTSFSVQSLGSPADGGLAYDAVHDLLYVIVSRTSVAMITPTGDLLGTLDISAADAHKPAGLALAPSSDDPSHQMSLYIVDRGVDNNTDPNENDGKIYEFHLNDWVIA